MDSPTYGCGHPKTPENSVRGHGVHKARLMCAFCRRVQRMNLNAERRRPRPPVDEILIHKPIVFFLR